MVSTLVQRLGREHEEAVEELLSQDPVVNLFLLGFLGVHPLDRAWWYGIQSGERLRGALMVLPGRLMVPYVPDDDDAQLLGEHLRATHRPCMIVGPRIACDRILKSWAPGVEPMRSHDQRLYTLKSPPPGRPAEGFRQARQAEWPTLAVQSGAMEEEDLGMNPYNENRRLHEAVVQDRAKSGRTWIIERGGEILFQCNVGTTTHFGCQIGGTYVPPRHRGRGWASAGVAALCRHLLGIHPIITLHVNEANVAAVRVYEKCGFSRAHALRLVTVQA